jgi:flagellar export protein FliJ
VRKFQFRLESLLKLRRQEEHVAELRQQQAHAQLRAAQRQVRLVKEELERTAQAVAGRLAAPVGMSEWLGGYNRSRQLGQALQAAEQRVREAAARVDEANAARAKVHAEVEALRHLRAQEWLEYRRELARAEQELLDEVGMRRWRKARSSGTFGTPARTEGDVP